MTMTDPIADFLTRLRNANSAYHDEVTLPHSKIKANIAEMNAAYQEFLLQLGDWWLANRGPRRTTMAAGVAKVYRVGEWAVGVSGGFQLRTPKSSRPFGMSTVSDGTPAEYAR